ncbi:unnamed protein product [Amoebophrya sp. A25]|nr:unnamed protein product [Amoebophrya sp. A25]|eukprot:GSA25T00004826001.1
MMKMFRGSALLLVAIIGQPQEVRGANVEFINHYQYVQYTCTLQHTRPGEFFKQDALDVQGLTSRTSSRPKPGALTAMGLTLDSSQLPKKLPGGDEYYLRVKSYKDPRDGSHVHVAVAGSPGASALETYAREFETPSSTRTGEYEADILLHSINGKNPLYDPDIYFPFSSREGQTEEVDEYMKTVDHKLQFFNDLLPKIDQMNIPDKIFVNLLVVVKKDVIVPVHQEATNTAGGDAVEEATTNAGVVAAESAVRTQQTLSTSFRPYLGPRGAVDDPSPSASEVRPEQQQRQTESSSPAAGAGEVGGVTITGGGVATSSGGRAPPAGKKSLLHDVVKAFPIDPAQVKGQGVDDRITTAAPAPDSPPAGSTASRRAGTQVSAGPGPLTLGNSQPHLPAHSTQPGSLQGHSITEASGPLRIVTGSSGTRSHHWWWHTPDGRMQIHQNILNNMNNKEVPENQHWKTPLRGRVENTRTREQGEEEREKYEGRTTIIAVDASHMPSRSNYGQVAAFVAHAPSAATTGTAASGELLPLRQGIAGHLKIPNYDSYNDAPWTKVKMHKNVNGGDVSWKWEKAYTAWDKGIQKVLNLPETDARGEMKNYFGFSTWCELTGLLSALQLNIESDLVLATDQMYPLQVLDRFVVPSLVRALLTRTVYTVYKNYIYRTQENQELLQSQQVQANPFATMAADGQKEQRTKKMEKDLEEKRKQIEKNVSNLFDKMETDTLGLGSASAGLAYKPLPRAAWDIFRELLQVHKIDKATPHEIQTSETPTITAEAEEIKERLFVGLGVPPGFSRTLMKELLIDVLKVQDAMPHRDAAPHREQSAQWSVSDLEEKDSRVFTALTVAPPSTSLSSSTSTSSTTALLKNLLAPLLDEIIDSAIASHTSNEQDVSQNVYLPRRLYAIGALLVERALILPALKPSTRLLQTELIFQSGHKDDQGKRHETMQWNMVLQNADRAFSSVASSANSNAASTPDRRRSPSPPLEAAFARVEAGRLLQQASTGVVAEGDFVKVEHEHGEVVTQEGAQNDVHAPRAHQTDAPVEEAGSSSDAVDLFTGFCFVDKIVRFLSYFADNNTSRLGKDRKFEKDALVPYQEYKWQIDGVDSWTSNEHYHGHLPHFDASWRFQVKERDDRKTRTAQATDAPGVSSSSTSLTKKQIVETVANLYYAAAGAVEAKKWLGEEIHIFQLPKALLYNSQVRKLHPVAIFESLVVADRINKDNVVAPVGGIPFLEQFDRPQDVEQRLRQAGMVLAEVEAWSTSSGTTPETLKTQSWSSSFGDCTLLMNFSSEAVLETAHAANVERAEARGRTVAPIESLAAWIKKNNDDLFVCRKKKSLVDSVGREVAAREGGDGGEVCEGEWISVS